MLRRVDDDLAIGHTHLAVNRLTMAAKAAPRDLGLRTRLAALHRQTGNWAEAGRWGYFEESVDERSREAFEKAWRDPRARRKALRWDRSEDDPALVRTRLDALESAPASEPDPDAPATESTAAGEWVGCLLAAAIVGFFLLGVGVALTTLVRWVL